jgi:hypothetical protein
MSTFAPLQRKQSRTQQANTRAPTHRPAPLRSRQLGLRPSQIPVRAVGGGALTPDVSGFGYRTSATAGGLAGLSLDVTFTASGTPAAGLQAVQTFMGTRRTDGVRVGTYSWHWQGKTWDAFVDGGKNSPFVTIAGNPVAHATRPYYLTASEVAHQVTWHADHGTIQVTDTPGAVAMHDEAHFETAIVAVNHGGTRRDKLLRAFKWGWTGRGTRPDVTTGTTIAGRPSGISVSSSVSPEFTNIVKHDYPTYALD